MYFELQINDDMTQFTKLVNGLVPRKGVKLVFDLTFKSNFTVVVTKAISKHLRKNDNSLHADSSCLVICFDKRGQRQ